jgi:hypothetical protein
MTSPLHPVISPVSRMARHGTPLAAIGSVGLLCGPETAAEQLAAMGALGGAWQTAIEAWRLSEATYCFFLAEQDDEGAALAFARPIIFCTSDRPQLERSVWSIVALRMDRPWVLDSLEPTLDGFVQYVKASQRLSAGHA